MDYNRYFQSFEKYFWHYEDGGEVIVMAGGTTIAYNNYVKEILGYLKEQGLPPYGSLLLAIVATGPNGESILERGFQVMLSDSKTPQIDREVISVAKPFLNMLASAPSEYKQGIKRMQLLQTIFRDCHNNVSGEKARKMLNSLDEDLQANKHLNFLARKPFNNLVFHKDFKTIELLFKRYPTIQSIMDSMAGLPTVADMSFMDLEEIPEAAPTDFVGQLIENNSTFRVGALIKRIWMGLNIPLHNVLPSEQPLGGVSDISNKGDFDKLLISEFAYDDITFMSRLANNEALYINREVPPASNPLQRIILIDVSLKSWGTPKTISYALMLAIAKHPKTDIDCVAFAIGDTYTPVEFNDIDQIIDALQNLESGLDSSVGLELFFKEYGKDKNIEVFYLSSFDTVKTNRMQKIMADYHSYFKYWIHSDVTGEIAVYRNQQNSKTHLQDIRLPLNELWAQNHISKRKKISEDIPSVSEQYFPVSKYPILFGHSAGIKAKLITEDGDIFLVTRTKNVVHLYDKRKISGTVGFELVHEKLPHVHGDFCIGKLKNGQFILSAFNPHNRELHVINMSEGKKDVVILTEWRASSLPQFFFHDDCFYYKTFSEVYQIRILPEITVTTMPYPKEFIDISSKQAQDNYKINLNPLSVLQNIDRIYININGNLVINIHELQYTAEGNFYLAPTSNKAVQVGANEFRDGKFIFPDGSSIAVHSQGMLVLRSDDEKIPPIYVPTVVSWELGMATAKEFAGNTYFYTSKNNLIHTRNFWVSYIKPFLDNIIRHGVKN